MVETWKWSPFVMLITLAGLSTLPTEPFESARIDGAGAWRIFWNITLPMIMPTVIVAVVLRSIDTLKLFDTIFAMTQGGPGTASETLNIYVFTMAFQYFRMGYASSVVVAFLVVILFVVLVLIKLRRRASQ
jgi:multiple sugar transport system permease protein